jgi:hypothetical protein
VVAVNDQATADSAKMILRLKRSARYPAGISIRLVTIVELKPRMKLICRSVSRRSSLTWPTSSGIWP